ncbi:MAG TPA: hypothetical protein VKH19_08835 [Gemmatimonadaceae bacterium]|nr:hypothetical protein [Gemmatimonadaceae bacterium]
MRPTKALLFLTFAAPLAAQTPAILPPSPILSLSIEEVKPGKGQAHATMEEGWAVAYARMKLPYYNFAFSRINGPDEMWYVQPWVSYTQMADAQKDYAKAAPEIGAALGAFAAREAEYLERHRSMFAEFRPEFSLGDSIDFGSVHGYKTIVYRVPFTHTQDFQSAAKTWVAAAKRAGEKRALLTYEVTEGAAGVGMMFLFIPFKSIAEYDGFAAEDARIVGAMTADERDAFFKSVNSFSGSESFTLMLSAEQSYVPASFAQADPDFWKSSAVFIAQAKSKKAAVTQAGTAKKKGQ